MLAKLLALISTVFLAHSAYSAYEHLAYLKAIDNTGTLPIEIVVECLASAFVTLLGVILSADPFKNILFEHEMAKMTIDKADNYPSFITFNHRHISSTQAQLDRQLK
ncbi:magnesium transporter [Syncephalastrum racemosum]|uniref:Magnesium transporter n=1 Tax=Syncephalastrum racemosum TaxID=13706 RepID=A0A1X2HAU1_SYNRA|nr:magnesium transporter [Syncephalastrum racemosum]